MTCDWIGWCALDPSSQAAWVQSIGSVGAILVAIAIPGLAAWRRRRQELIATQRRTRRGAALLYIELAELSRLLLNFDEQHAQDDAIDESDDGTARIDFWKLDSDFLSVIPRLTTLIASIDTFGSVDDDLYKLVTELSAYQMWMRHMSDVMTAGYNNHMFLTSRAEQRERAQDIATMTDRVMAKLR